MNKVISKRFLQLMKSYSYYRYFFQKLEDPELIPILGEHGLLSYKPEYGGYLWTLDYLCRVLDKGVHKYDQLILDMLYEYKNTLNSTDIAQHNFLRLSRLCHMLGPKYARQTIPIIQWCLEHKRSSKDMVIHEIKQLMEKLHSGGYNQEIRKLFRIVFRLNTTTEKVFDTKEIVFQYDSYWSRELFKGMLSIIQSDDPIFYFKFLVAEYRSALKLIHPKEEGYEWSDTSYITRPAIEESEQNRGYSDEDAVIQMLKNILDHIVSEGKKKSLMKILLKEKYPIFKRLALYKVTKDFEVLGNEFAAQLLSTENFGNYHLTHEIYQLLETHYSSLTNKDKDRINEIISKGLKGIKEDLTKEQKKRYNFQWQLQWLSAIQKCEPDDGRMVNIKMLETNLGYKPAHPEHITYSVSKSGWDSPISVKELSAKSWKQIKEYLLEFDESKVERTLEHRPEYEGLAQIFSSVIEGNKDEFMKNLELFKDPNLRTCYIRSIPEALIPQENVYNRQYLLPCLDYLNWVYDLVEKGELSFFDDRYYSLFIAFKRFFGHLFGMFNYKANEIPQDDVKLIADFLERYDVSHHKEEIEMDNPYQDFINRLYGVYLMAWLAINNYLVRQGIKDSFLPPLKAILDKGVGNDPFVHVLLGKFLSTIYDLDEEWVKSNFNRIFPQDKSSDLWVMTLKSFLWTRGLSNALFTYLLPQLTHAARLGLDGTQASSLSERIGVYYLRDATHSKCYNELIIPLFQNSDVGIEIFTGLARFFKGSYNEKENGKRIRKYVRYRYGFIRENPVAYASEITELLTLHSCFPNMNDRDYLIFRFLLLHTDKWHHQNRIVELHKHFVGVNMIRELYQLIRIDFGDQVGLRMYDGEYKMIFRALYNSGIGRIQRGVNRIINRQGELGDYNYRDLYEEYLAGAFPQNSHISN